ncbi:MAG: hypothetical protein K0Q72_714, partial [Armatimonadetes bacterium]|nr:hypothetical protein [Armatimonadota bacterium]
MNWETLSRAGLGFFAATVAAAAVSAAAVSPAATVERIPPASAIAALDRLQLRFEPNVGQAPRSFGYVARGRGYTLALSATEAAFSVFGLPASEPRAVAPPQEASTIRMRLLGADPDAAAAGVTQQRGRVHYFVGNDPRKWRTDVPTFGGVRFAGVYPGVDAVYYGSGRQLEYDFVVRPGADPNRIRLGLSGAERVEVAADGELVLTTRGGEWKQHRPVAYQERDGRRSSVAARYVLQPNTGEVTFALGRYDRSRPLVIDPVLAFSSFLGGNAADSGSDIAIDDEGALYVAGSTLSGGFPFTSGVGITGLLTAFVTKIDSSGQGMDFSVYLGGGNHDYATGIALGPTGDIYLTGYTHSNNFPVVNAVQTGFGGGTDSFVVRLSPDGDALRYSTYLGGTDTELSSHIAVGLDGSAYVAGRTMSSDFPQTTTLSQPAASSVDGYVARLAPLGSSLIYSAVLGGSGSDVVEDIAVDPIGSAYVTGSTFSADFPVVNALFGANAAGSAFVTRINAPGSALLFSTYLGGSGEEAGMAIAVDASTHVHVAGFTTSSDFPVANAYDADQNGGRDGFVVKLNATGSTQLFGTYLGGSDDDLLTSLAVDSSGLTYVTGRSRSGNYPLSQAVQELNRGGEDGDVVVAQLRTATSELLFSTYFGGAGNDTALGIAADVFGGMYVTGETTSFNFPSFNALQPTSGQGSSDAFFLKFSPILPPAAPTGLVVTALSSSMARLDWIDRSDNEGGFRIERKDGPAAAALPWVPQALVQPNNPTFTNSVLPSTTYTFRVQAVNIGGRSVFTPPVEITMPPPPPAAPSGLTVRALAQRRLDLEWQDNSDSETGFEIERKAPGGIFFPIAQVGIDQTSYQDLNLDVSTTYVYRVRAVNTGGGSDYTAEVTETTVPLPPSAPADLVVTADSATQLNLSWTDTSSNETGFEVERQRVDATWEYLSTVTAGTTFADAGRPANTSLTYRVRAVNSGGASAYTTPASGYTLPLAPVGLSIPVVSQTGLEIHWTDPNPVPATFVLERSEAGGPFSLLGSAANSPVYVDTGLSPNTAYAYRVWGSNPSGRSEAFGEVSEVTWPVPPTAPTGLLALAAAVDRINLSWTDTSTNESGFEVEQRNPDASWTRITTVADGTQYAVTGLPANTSQTFRVRAVNRGGASTYAEATPALTYPLAPTGFQVITSERTRLGLHWSEANPLPAAYRLERRSGSGPFVLLVLLPVGATSYLDSPLIPSTEYTYRLTAVNATGSSPASVEATGT